ncbi:Odorant receptor 98a like [Actinidia chinensis var. chinensis]|uniref:Odorant receptor 98a like n=1 Tax=Actinidia chinensis var. chinensis TaxID=1590841 RepID=A0A2R6R5R2_ACTCC|nr:Odorant receptor 98a like [Actinidia chinensis var. chinensis]
MGICSSCDSTSVATTKLILQDGQLQEFSYPVRVSYILQKYPSCFICNSDEMDFDDVVSAVNDDEELQLGQLYFALPLSRLRHPLQAEEMAALAVKANSALMRSGGDKCRCHKRSLSPVTFSDEKGGKPSRRVADGGGRKPNFTAKLSAITE